MLNQVIMGDAILDALISRFTLRKIANNLEDARAGDMLFGMS